LGQKADAFFGRACGHLVRFLRLLALVYLAERRGDIFPAYPKYELDEDVRRCFPVFAVFSVPNRHVELARTVFGGFFSTLPQRFSALSGYHRDWSFLGALTDGIASFRHNWARLCAAARIQPFCVVSFNQPDHSFLYNFGPQASRHRLAREMDIGYPGVALAPFLYTICNICGLASLFGAENPVGYRTSQLADVAFTVRDHPPRKCGLAGRNAQAVYQ